MWRCQVAEQSVNFGGKAVVIGASMGGLLAARALADHFEQVTLLERDTFPPVGKNRKGVPQGKHTHVLLGLGREIMECYLPGLTQELTQLGAVRIADASLNVRWFNEGGFHKPGASGFPAVGVSRPTLEAAVRARVLALPNVQAIEDCDVRGLVTAAGNGRVTGVRLVRRQEGTAEESMAADLVVDAGGRGSRSPSWLQALGYERPVEDEVRIDIGYTTCFFRRHRDHTSGIHGIVVMPTPPDKRMAVLLPQDGERWVVTIGGYLGHHAPTDLAGFLEAAKELPAVDIYNRIKDAQPLTEPVAYKFRANLRRRYEKLERFPNGYVVFGDALCSFNPIYGQGMTVAAMEAAILDECLAAGRGRLAKRFFSKASKIIDESWRAAVGNDLRFPEVEGVRTPMQRFLNWYIQKLHVAAHNDSQVSIAFLKVINMLAPAPSIMHPRIVLRVLKGNLLAGRDRASQSETQFTPLEKSGKRV
jgi:2-polyprenyl-6-methoxyphenol hydroxylase-like FAD-dependent oxidoreductase